MASSIFHTLSLILFHLLLASSARTPTPTKQTGFRATLTRVQSGRALPKYTSTNTLDNDPSTSLIKSPMKAFKDEYTMTLSIGTPPVSFSAMMDTGSDLIWIKDSLFDTSKSTSFSNVDKTCSEFELESSGAECKQTYADGNSVSVRLGQETLKIGKGVFKNVTFGYGTPHGIPYNGIVGMGRGDFSLISQLQQSVFSYCLGSRLGTKTSSVLLTGSKLAKSEHSNTQTTPLLKQEGKPYYYISLEGISVGKTKLSVTQSDFAMNSYGDGGMIIDSGTTFTYLDGNIIDMISNEFMNQTNLEKSNDTASYDGLEHCFMYQGYNKDLAPKLVFHFEGAADWELPRENYLYETKGKNVACLAFIANNEKEDSNVSIFGNIMQQNMLVIYDLDDQYHKESLSFKPANCNQF